MKILLFHANPDRDLDLEQEVRLIRTELEGVQNRDSIDFVVGGAVQGDDMVKLIRREHPEVVHFSGHGSAGGVYARDVAGEATLITESALVQLFDGRDLALVVLNACYAEEQANLISKVVGCVVGTTDAVVDSDAQIFSRALYRGLGDGLTVGESLRDARDAVVVEGGIDVFMAVGDLDFRLFEPPAIRISKVQRDLLWAVADAGSAGVYLFDLKEALGLDRASVVYRAKDLEAQGLISIAHLTDYRYQVTEQGEEVLRS